MTDIGHRSSGEPSESDATRASEAPRTLDAEAMEAFNRRLHRELREYLATAHLRILSADVNDPPQARITSFSDMTFARSRISRMRVELPGDGTPLDRVVLGIVHRGCIRIRRIEVGAGRVALILPSTEPILVEAVADSNEITYISCTPAILEGLPVLDRSEPCLIADVDSVQLQPFLSFVTSVCTLESKTKTRLESLAGVSRNLVRELMQIVVNTAPAPPDLYTRALDVMRSEYTTVALSTDSIASRLGTSARSLQAAFSRRGDTVVGVLRRFRARAALVNRAANPSSSAKQIARMSGFGSDSSMFRAIRMLRHEIESEKS